MEESKFENLSTDEKLTYGEIASYSEHTAFGDKFSVRDYWITVKGWNPEYLTKEIEKDLFETFEKLVKVGKFIKNDDGTYSLIKPNDSSSEDVLNKPPEQNQAEKEETTEEEKITSLIDGELLKKLKEAGIKIEATDALFNMAFYDESEKTLKIRRDADNEHVNNYIRDAVFKEEDGIDRLDQNVKRDDYIHIEDDGDEKEEDDSETEEYDTGEEDEKSEDNEGKDLTPELVPTSAEEDTPEWKKGEEWEEFEKNRSERAKTQVALNRATLFETKKGSTFINPFSMGTFSKDEMLNIYDDMRDMKNDANFIYNEQRNKIIDKIRESLTAEAKNKAGAETLTPEQETDLQKEINDTIFEALIKEEHDKYMQALRDAKGETAVGKALEGAKNLLKTKAAKWYLGLSRNKRIGLSWAIGSMAGLVAGATVAPGMIGVGSYLAWRAARVAASGYAGYKTGEWANKKWSVEELNEDEEKEIEELKNSDLSMKEKADGFAEIKDRYRKLRTKATLKRIGATAAAGAGTGFLTGLAEHAVMGVGGAAKSAAESHGSGTGKVTADNLNKVPRGSNVGQQNAEQHLNQAPSQEKTEIIQEAAKVEAAETQIARSEIFKDPSVLNQEVEQGDSLWKIIKRTLDSNEDFKKLNPAQQHNIVSHYVNNGIKNPENYGLTPDDNFGVKVEIGKQVGLAKLFENPEEYQRVFQGAKNLSDEAQQKILEKSTRVADYLKEHSGEKMTVGKTEEIISEKPAVPTPPKPEEVMPEPINHEIPPPENPKPEQFEMPAKSNTVAGEIMNELGRSKINQSPEVGVGVARAGVAAGFGVINGGKRSLGENNEEVRRQIEKDVEEAKKRLEVLEGGNEGSKKDKTEMDKIGMDAVIRTYSHDVHNANSFNKVDSAYNIGINSIYDHKGFLGVGKISGVDTKEYKTIAGMDSEKVIEYYTGDSARSGLSEKDIKSLREGEEKHQKLISQLFDFIKESNGDLKIKSRESVASLVKRAAEKALEKKRTHEDELNNQALINQALIKKAA